MRIKIICLFLILFISFSILGGCSQNKAAEYQTGPNNVPENFTVVTSFYPMYISTINVTKDIPSVTVINMTKPQTGCLHDYQLTPADLIILETADAFVVNGAGMESFLDDVIKQQKNLKIVEASKGIELIKDESGEENPHVWVSISDAILQVRNIAGQLSAIDKTNAEKYKSNAEAYISELEVLKEKMHDSLENIKSRDIITFHESFPYFAREFDLNIVAVIEREPGTAPSPKELEETIKIVNDSKVKVLFAEPQYPVKAAETIANETGAVIYALDPAVTGDSGVNAYDEYLYVMESNLKSLLEALN